MKRNLLAISLLLLSAVLLVAEDINVSGTWKISMKSPRGERTVEMEIKQDGENITVLMPGRDGSTHESKGTIKGNEISWSSTRETPRGSMTLSYKGTVDGDTMKGKVDFGGRRSSDWNAKRVAAE